MPAILYRSPILLAGARQGPFGSWISDDFAYSIGNVGENTATVRVRLESDDSGFAYENGEHGIYHYPDNKVPPDRSFTLNVTGVAISPDGPPWRGVTVIESDLPMVLFRPDVFAARGSGPTKEEAYASAWSMWSSGVEDVEWVESRRAIYVPYYNEWHETPPWGPGWTTVVEIFNGSNTVVDYRVSITRDFRHEVRQQYPDGRCSVDFVREPESRYITIGPGELRRFIVSDLFGMDSLARRAEEGMIIITPSPVLPGTGVWARVVPGVPAPFPLGCKNTT